MNEDPLLMRALRDFNMPKIITDDQSIFLNLLADLFPGHNPIVKTDEVLMKDVAAVTVENR
jgi:dynein heavy chain